MQRLLFSFFLFFSLIISALAHENDLTSIDLDDVNIKDALHIVAKFIHQNIIISQNINGTVSLHLHHISANDIFNLILTTHHLIKKKLTTKIWFIAPYDILVEQYQQEIKLQTLDEEAAPLRTQIWQIHYAKANDIATMLQEAGSSFLSKRGHLRVDLRTNIICVQDTEKKLVDLQTIIRRLDVPVQQVLIEARLVSMDSDYERELGLNFMVQAMNEHSGTTNPKRLSLAVARLADCSLLDIQLSAMENAGRGELISNPSLFTANQQTASIESGEEIPYQEVSNSGGTAVAFKKAVLSLKVTPQILPEKKVLLQLQVNQDRPSNRVIMGVPAINTRQISTDILLNNGQTIVLGGIYECNHESSEQRIPFFDKIPLVGSLFKQQNVAQNKRELLIFVTPKIIAQKELSEINGQSKT